MEKVIELFLEYVQIDTESAEESTTMPSTMKQHDLAALLEKQLREMGAAEIVYDKEHCYVYASIPATVGCEDAPVIGFIAHMDTSPAVTGAGVKPRIIENYDGRDIVLSEEKQVVMRVADFPELASCQGKRLIVTDGTTLLGADDKAGVAEIMAMASYLLQLPMGKKCGSVLRRTKKSGPGRIILMWSCSERIMPIPWTAVRWERWSSRISTRPEPKCMYTAGACIRDRRRTRCAMPS